MTQAATLAEISAIVLASGQWAGVGEPEFSVDGSKWSTVFIPTEINQHPRFARATVHRAGAVPTSVTISWDESLPADEVWRERWFRRPMSLFGARAIRAAYRRAFGDIVEVVPNPAEGDDVADTAQAPAPSVDWSARIQAVSSLDELEQLGKEMKKQRAFDTVLNRQWKARKAELTTQREDTELAAAMAALADRVAGDEKERHARPTPLVMAKNRGRK